MDWHDFKVLSMYGVIVCVFFIVIVGKVEYGVLGLIGYSIFGVFLSIKRFLKSKSLNQAFEGLPEYIKEITTCHILKRNPKLKKRVVKSIKKDIINGNFKAERFRLTEKISIPPVEADSNFEYFLLFDDSSKYQVKSIVYDASSVGDTLWIVTTTTEEMKVIQSKTEYFNMFTYVIKCE